MIHQQIALLTSLLSRYRKYSIGKYNCKLFRSMKFYTDSKIRPFEATVTSEDLTIYLGKYLDYWSGTGTWCFFLNFYLQNGRFIKITVSFYLSLLSDHWVS